MYTSRSKFEMQPSGRQRIAKLLIYFIVFFLIVSFLWYALPRATITIVPKKEEVVGERNVVLDGTATVTLASSTLPVIHFSKSFQRTKTFPASGSIDIGKKARGTAVFTNKTGLEWPLTPDHDLLGSRNKRYRVLKSVSIPKASVNPEGEIQYGAIELEVEARAGGPDSNLESGNVLLMLSLPENRRDKVFGTVADAIAGGTSNVVRAVVSEDVIRATEQMTTDALQEARIEQSLLLGTNTFVDHALMRLVRTATTSVPALQEPAQEFAFTLDADIVGLAVPREHIARFLVQEDAIRNRDVQSLDKNSITYSFQNIVFDKNGYQANANIKYSIFITPELHMENLIQGVLGKKERDARFFLLSQVGVSDVIIDFSWSILRTVPEDRSRVTFQIK